MMETKTLDPIEAVDRAYGEGIDTWELLVSIGASDEEEMGVRRWRHGDLALRVEKHYGDDALSSYASAIGVKVPTLKQRRQMSRFYEKDTRVAFSNLFYSHYREAMRYGDIDRAMKALDKASSRTWPVWKFEQFVDRCIGKTRQQSESVDGGITRLYKQDDGYYVVVRVDSEPPLKTGQAVTIRSKQA